ncbi:hypothetical protein H1R20_g7981, partial [Candolleomyces eurysporus]
MPLRQSTGQEGKAASQNLQDIRLFLPSDVVPDVPCSEKLTSYEFKYRIAQAHVTLRDLRERLIVRQHMFNSKKRYSHGTTAITRSNKKIELEGMRINELAGRYRSIREKLVVLSRVLGDWSWGSTLKVLEDQDIRGLTTEDRRHAVADKTAKKNKLGEGKRRLTWIWFVSVPRRTKEEKSGEGGMRVLERTQVESDNEDDGDGSCAGDKRVEDEDEEEDENDAALRIEFCTIRARAHRWQEECMLLAEEMKRIERFWAWEAKQWSEREEAYAQQALSPVVQLPPSEMQHPELVDRAREATRMLAIGKVAYARQQTVMRERLLEDSKQCLDVYGQLAVLHVFGKDLDWRVMVDCAAPLVDEAGQETASTPEVH